MPVYDLLCDQQHVQRDVLATYGAFPVCPTCGAPTHPDVSRKGGVRDDSFIGGRTFENLSNQPMTFYSKTDYRRYLKSRNLEEFVRHAPPPGSDKSPHTVKWGGIAPETLEGARLLLERVGLAPQTEPTYIADLQIVVSDEHGTVRAPRGLLGGGHVG